MADITARIAAHRAQMIREGTLPQPLVPPRPLNLEAIEAAVGTAQVEEEPLVAPEAELADARGGVAALAAASMEGRDPGDESDHDDEPLTPRQARARSQAVVTEEATILMLPNGRRVTLWADGSDRNRVAEVILDQGYDPGDFIPGYKHIDPITRQAPHVYPKDENEALAQHDSEVEADETEAVFEDIRRRYAEGDPAYRAQLMRAFPDILGDPLPPKKKLDPLDDLPPMPPGRLEEIHSPPDIHRDGEEGPKSEEPFRPAVPEDFRLQASDPVLPTLDALTKNLRTLHSRIADLDRRIHDGGVEAALLGESIDRLGDSSDLLETSVHAARTNSEAAFVNVIERLDGIEQAMLILADAVAEAITNPLVVVNPPTEVHIDPSEHIVEAAYDLVDEGLAPKPEGLSRWMRLRQAFQASGPYE